MVKRGCDDMAECHDEKDDQFFIFAEFYEKEAAKASKDLYRIIGSLDSMLYNGR